MKEKDKICANCKNFDQFYVTAGMSFIANNYGFCTCKAKPTEISETCADFLTADKYPTELANLHRSVKMVAGDVWILQRVFEEFEKKVIVN